jgi:hypothetical protein
MTNVYKNIWFLATADRQLREYRADPPAFIIKYFLKYLREALKTTGLALLFVAISLLPLYIYGPGISVFFPPPIRDVIISGIEWINGAFTVPIPFSLKMGVAIGTPVLFALRGYFPKIYGCLEIVAGIYAIFYTPDIIPHSIPEALPLLTGAYIVVRGLDNIAKHLDKTGVVGRYFSVMFNNPIREPKKRRLKRPPNSPKPTS